MVRKVYRPRERIAFVVYDVSPRQGFAPGTRRPRPIARGVRRYRPEVDIRFVASRAREPEPTSRNARLNLDDDYGLELTLDRIPALSGFAINVTRPSVRESFGWNWFTREVFPEFRRRGDERVWIETDDDGRTEEIVAVHFATDVTIGATSVVALEKSDPHDVEVVIAKGSVLRVR